MDKYPQQSYFTVYGQLAQLFKLVQQGLLSPVSYAAFRDCLIDSHFRNLQAYEVRLRGGAR